MSRCVFPVSMVLWSVIGLDRMLNYASNRAHERRRPPWERYLRRGREQSGLSMEAVAAGSRIVPRLVEALEADRQDLLPAPVYVRGFIRAYCEQIGADPEEALRLYDEQAAPPPPLTMRPSPQEAPKVSFARRWGRAAALSAVGGAVASPGFVLLGRRQPDALASRGSGAVATASSLPHRRRRRGARAVRRSLSPRRPRLLHRPRRPRQRPLRRPCPARRSRRTACW